MLAKCYRQVCQGKEHTKPSAKSWQPRLATAPSMHVSSHKSWFEDFELEADATS